MISLRQARDFFITIILAVMLAITIAFDFGTAASWAATSTSHIDQPQTQIAALNRVESMVKNIEGKTQEAIGNVTGDPKDQMMGKAKQAESQVRNAAAEMKDKMQLKGRAKAVTKNIDGKIEAAEGRATGNREAQASGRAKQVEGQARNAVEDIKDKVRDILN